MNEIFKQLETLLTDYKKDQNNLVDNNELALAYNSDFYEMLTQIKTKLEVFLYEQN